MSARGMIMQERTDEVLASAMLEVFARQPRATWLTVEQLADASPHLERCGGDRYEVVKLGATVSADEVRAAAIGAIRRGEDAGLLVDYDRKLGFAVFDRAG